MGEVAGRFPPPVTAPVSRPVPEALSADDALRRFAAAKEWQVKEPVPPEPAEPVRACDPQYVPPAEESLRLHWRTVGVRGGSANPFP